MSCGSRQTGEIKYEEINRSRIHTYIHIYKTYKRNGSEGKAGESKRKVGDEEGRILRMGRDVSKGEKDKRVIGQSVCQANRART